MSYKDRGEKRTFAEESDFKWGLGAEFMWYGVFLLTKSVESHSIKKEMINILAVLKGAGSYGFESGGCR